MLVLETIGAALTILFDCEHRFAEHEHEHEHEHEEFRTVPQSRTLISFASASDRDLFDADCDTRGQRMVKPGR